VKGQHCCNCWNCLTHLGHSELLRFSINIPTLLLLRILLHHSLNIRSRMNFGQVVFPMLLLLLLLMLIKLLLVVTILAIASVITSAFLL